ncbi:hypothetical protein AB1Y20_005374 [Prymnesium parvum]
MAAAYMKLLPLLWATPLLANPDVFQAHAKEMFSHMDANKDGFLEFSEIQMMLESKPAKAKGIVAKEFFVSLDKDEDEKLSLLEVQDFFVGTHVETAHIKKEHMEKAEMEQFKHMMMGGSGGGGGGGGCQQA